MANDFFIIMSNPFAAVIFSERLLSAFNLNKYANLLQV